MIARMADAYGNFQQVSDTLFCGYRSRALHDEKFERKNRPRAERRLASRQRAGAPAVRKSGAVIAARFTCFPISSDRGQPGPCLSATEDRKSEITTRPSD